MDWWSGEYLPPDARVELPREGKAAIRSAYPEGMNQHQEWAINITRRHREIVNRITAHYRSAWESELQQKTYGVPDNESEVARAVAKQLEYHLYDLRGEMARRGLLLPELPPGMKISERPGEEIVYDENGEVVGRRTQHGPPLFPPF